MSQKGRRFFVSNNPPYRAFRAPKTYEVQLLDDHGQAKATGYFDSADEELVIEGVQVDRRVLLAALAQVAGKGTYVDEAGNPINVFGSCPESRKRSDSGEPAGAYRVEDTIKGLRDALSHEMARKAYRIRYKREPTASELTEFREKLVNEHYDEGFDTWIEKYLYFDPHA
jgi:hypothetical protein